MLPVKRRKKGWKIATALGLTAIVAVGAVVFCVKSGENMEHPFVELYGDSYEILTKEKLGHTITITDNGLDWLGDAVMQLSPDRKYLYYMETMIFRRERPDSTGVNIRSCPKRRKNEKYKQKLRQMSEFFIRWKTENSFISTRIPSCFVMTGKYL